MTIANTAAEITLTAVSENALLLTWPEIICAQQHQQIITCQQLINQRLSHLIIETVASYNSLMVYYPFEKITLSNIHNQLNELCQQLAQPAPRQAADVIVEIPVYYGTDAGWDLSLVAQQTQLSIGEVIRRHSGQTYHAYALGFTPGFCYLGRLDKSLSLPRRSSPRVHIPKGAVAIAEQQTAVYPKSSPGGWHIIGQTPMPMFTIEQQENQQSAKFTPAISVGQQVVFKSIELDEFIALGGQLALASSKQHTTKPHALTKNAAKQKSKQAEDD